MAQTEEQNIPEPDNNQAEPTAAMPQDQDNGARIQALEAEIAQMRDQALRALAEAENTRRRAVKEREDAGKYAVTSFARDLLPVVDNFRRAVDSIPAELRAADDRIKNLIAGIEAVERDMLGAFEKHGVRKITPLNEPFNPNFHEVMFESPGTGKPAGTIVQVIESGYLIADRLLRPARVGVAKDDGVAAHQVDTQA